MNKRNLYFSIAQSMYRLKLVVSDASKLPDKRNTILMVKSSVPTLHRLYETRWSKKIQEHQKVSMSCLMSLLNWICDGLFSWQQTN